MTVFARRTLVSTTALAAFVTLAFGSGDADEQGVKTGSDMTPNQHACVADAGFLEPGEKVITYYDATISLDCSELSIITDRRVIHHVSGNTSSVRLEDVESLDIRDEGMIGDVVDVRAKDGTRVHLNINSKLLTIPV